MSEDSDGETHAKKLPALKVNSNDLKWLREQRLSKDTDLIQQEIPGYVVRLSTQPRKVSRFYIPPVESTQDHSQNVEDTEEIKDSAIPLENPATIVVSPHVTQFVVYCQCGNLCETDNPLCKKCIEKQIPVEFSGKLYYQSGSDLKLCWFRLLNKELYCNFPLSLILYRL